MPQTIKKITYWVVGVAMILLLGLFVWSLFFSGSNTAPGPVKALGGLFGLGGSATFTVSGGGGNTASSTGDVVQSGAFAGQAIPANKIFKIAEGPIVGATFVETRNPTTTLARYVAANDGHAFDMPLDVPGAVARIVSGTTIPGLVSTLWAEQGASAVVQYVENQTIKTVFVGFPVASSTLASGQTAPRVHFLPNNIASLAVSPDGKSLAYLLKTAGGSAGYITDIASFNDKKLFSLPLAELVLSWPTQNALLAQSKSAAGVPGAAFSITTKSGGTSLLVYALGLSASANGDFSKIVYQKNEGGGATPTSLVHDGATGRDASLPFNPYPERCVWSPRSLTTAVCAAPLASQGGSYLDLWHMGLAHNQDGIFSFDLQYGVTSLLALPGSKQGGSASDIASVSLSRDGTYLLYITRGDRSLWGVRL